MSAVTILDHTCRLSKGGCGREIVVVEEPLTGKQLRGWLYRSNCSSKKIGVHAGEEDGRKVLPYSHQAFTRYRKVVEEACLGKRERGELE